MARGDQCKHYGDIGVVERRQSSSGVWRCVLCQREHARLHAARRRTTGHRPKQGYKPYRSPVDRQFDKKPTPEAARAKQGMRFAPGETVSSIILKQGGKCLICNVELATLSPRRVHVDHDHRIKSGPNVRGVLCNTCNVGIGHLKDSIPVLEAAIRYLRNAERSTC